MFEIESSPHEMDPECPCCGDRAVRLTKSVFKNDKPWAVFYGLYSNRHPEHGLRALLSLGPWWKEARPERRTCFYFQVFAEPNGNVCRFGDVATSCWGADKSMGIALEAADAERHRLKDEALRIFDLLASEDPRINGFLQRVRGGDADYPLEPRFGLPDEVFALSEAERTERVKIYDDFVVLDGERCFMRLNLPMPLAGRNPWYPAVWAEISPRDLDRLADIHYTEDKKKYLEFTCSGRIANDTEVYHLPDFFGAEVQIRVPHPQKLPVAHQSDHQELHERLTEPWEARSFEEFAVLNGFL